MPIVELFLSTVVETLLTELASRVLSEYARINGISEKLNNWKLKLELILAVVDSAQERQKDGNPAVDRWLANLKDVAYDKEDLLDHFHVEANQSVCTADTRPAKRTFSQFIGLQKIDPRPLLKDHWMANEIEQVDRRLEEVLRLKEILKFDETFAAQAPSIHQPSQSQSQGKSGRVHLCLCHEHGIFFTSQFRPFLIEGEVKTHTAESLQGVDRMEEFGKASLLQMAADLLNDRLPEAREAARGVAGRLHECVVKEEASGSEEKMEAWQSFCQGCLPPARVHSIVKIMMTTTTNNLNLI